MCQRHFLRLTLFCSISAFCFLHFNDSCMLLVSTVTYPGAQGHLYMSFLAAHAMEKTQEGTFCRLKETAGGLSRHPPFLINHECSRFLTQWYCRWPPLTMACFPVSIGVVGYEAETSHDIVAMFFPGKIAWWLTTERTIIFKLRNRKFCDFKGKCLNSMEQYCLHTVVFINSLLSKKYMHLKAIFDQWSRSNHEWRPSFELTTSQYRLCVKHHIKLIA